MNIKFIKWLSQPEQMKYISSATGAEREQRKTELKARFDNQSSFSSVNFSGYVEDTGNPDFFDFTLDEVNSFPELSALGKIRRITENHQAVTDAKAYAEMKNSIVRRNKERTKNGN